jgi:hypothetical protein
MRAGRGEPVHPMSGASVDSPPTMAGLDPHPANVAKPTRNRTRHFAPIRTTAAHRSPSDSAGQTFGSLPSALPPGQQDPARRMVRAGQERATKAESG